MIIPMKLMKIELITLGFNFSPNQKLAKIVVQIGDVRKIACASLRLSILIP